MTEMEKMKAGLGLKTTLKSSEFIDNLNTKNDYIYSEPCGSCLSLPRGGCRVVHNMV